MLAVTNVGSGEAAEPVTGLEATLRAELRGAGERIPLPLAPQVDSDGSGQEAETGLDEAPFLLTTPGDYKVRLVGNIEGIPIDAALFSHSVTPGWFDPLAAPQLPEIDGRRERQREASPLLATNARVSPDQTQTYLGIAVGTRGLRVGLALWRARFARMRNTAMTGQHPSEQAPRPADRQ